MSGEKNLQKLLASLSPELLNGAYVFRTFPDAHYGDHADLEPIVSCREPEGLTLIIPKSKAHDPSLGHEPVFKCISLGIHSSLEAVGLTAAISQKLSRYGISANIVAGYHHDYIFVPIARAEEALRALHELARSYP